MHLAHSTARNQLIASGTVCSGHNHFCCCCTYVAYQRRISDMPLFHKLCLHTVNIIIWRSSSSNNNDGQYNVQSQSLNLVLISIVWKMDSGQQTHTAGHTHYLFLFFETHRKWHAMTNNNEINQAIRAQRTQPNNNKKNMFVFCIAQSWNDKRQSNYLHPLSNSFALTTSTHTHRDSVRYEHMYFVFFSFFSLLPGLICIHRLHLVSLSLCLSCIRSCSICTFQLFVSAIRQTRQIEKSNWNIARCSGELKFRHRHGAKSCIPTRATHSRLTRAHTQKMLLFIDLLLFFLFVCSFVIQIAH